MPLGDLLPDHFRHLLGAVVAVGPIYYQLRVNDFCSHWVVFRARVEVLLLLVVRVVVVVEPPLEVDLTVNFIAELLLLCTGEE